MINLNEIFQPVDREDDRQGFVTAPAQLYPALLAHVEQVLGRAVRPSDPALAQLYDEALTLPSQAWSLALQSKNEIEETWHPVRAAALEIARKWGTELLHQAVGGGPMAIRILADPRFRL